MARPHLDRFADLVGRPGGPSALDEPCFLIAAALGEPIDPAAEVAGLDRLADGIVDRSVDGLRTHLFGSLGFRGDGTTYGAIDNSLLNRVVDRRAGIPITLSVLAIEVGRRIDVPLVGVGMPGHFLVQDGTRPDRFLDPFSGGVVLDGAACRRVFAQLHGESVPFDPSYLAPSTDLAILGRVLANLRNACRRVGDHRRLAEVLRLRSALPGSGGSDLEELGSALERTGAFDDAAAALDRAAALVHPADRDRLVERARASRARMN